MSNTRIVRSISDLIPGDHACFIYDREDDHEAVLTPFLCEGLNRREKILYLAGAHTAETILGYLAAGGVDVRSRQEEGQLVIRTAPDRSENKEFRDPTGKIAEIARLVDEAATEGWRGLRITGEETSSRVLASSAVLEEYNAALDQFVRRRTLCVLCQYDKRHFDAARLLDALHNHPIAVIGRAAFDNGYYVPPHLLRTGDDAAASAVRFCLDRLQARARAQEALRASEARLRTAMNSLPFDVFILDMDGRYIMQNTTCTEHWGNIVGKRPVDVAPDRHTLAVWEDNNERAMSGEVVQDEVRFTVRGEDRVLYNVISPIYEAQQVQGILGVNIDVTALRGAQTKLLAYQDQLRSLAAELSAAEERERRRIASELHDRIGQVLAVAKIKLGAARTSAPSPKLGEALDEVKALVDQAINDSRTLTFELSPPILYEFGFEAAAEWLTEQVQREHGLAAAFETDGREKPLDAHVAMVLFYATREALFNVVKHARAGRVTVAVRRVGSRIIVEVSDDGIGFTWTAADFRSDRAGGFGLFNIRERLDRLGGQLQVRAGPSSGSTVVLAAPIRTRAEKDSSDKAPSRE